MTYYGHTHVLVGDGNPLFYKPTPHKCYTAWSAVSLNTKHLTLLHVINMSLCVPVVKSSNPHHFNTSGNIVTILRITSYKSAQKTPLKKYMHETTGACTLAFLLLSIREYSQICPITCLE
jgi:hypothetical protein